MGSVKPAPKKKAKKHNKKAATQDNLQGHPTAIALVAHCLDKSPDGLSIKELQEHTGFPARKLYGVLRRLKQQGRVNNFTYGFYKKILSEYP